MAEKILIVDDSLDNRNLLAVILKKSGYEIIEAIDGEQAIDLTLSYLPDLVLLDIIMPKKDGYQVCGELKHDNRAKNIPIIFLSAKSETKDKIKGLRLGGADYITKPFNKGEVLARVKSQLKIRNLTKSLIDANNQLLEKQKKIDEDLKAAAHIQKSLIARIPPKVKNFVFSWRFIPCDRIGGDIFNIHRLDESHLSIYVVDVSGHGVPSAMVTVSVSQALSPQTGSALKKKLDKFPYYKIIPPAEVLKNLDQEYPIERFDKYFTIAYLIINTQSGVIYYSSAAHPMPVLVRANGEIETLCEGGTIVGMGGVIPFEEGTVRMRQGDRLFLYTDGIVEYFNETGEYYGKERFYRELVKNRKKPIDTACERVIESLMSYGKGTNPQDDITLLAIECLGFDKSG